ncbi:MAG TPA: protein kinase [Gemmatimonadales bacterium]|nr:protein kinase [Gemmatimonadales bacterium]
MMDSARLAAALADRYRIERELGQGGMATVYLAEDLKHRRRVAIKVLRPELAAVIGAERFLREIQTIATLQHPHILGLIDSGEVNGTAYYVMPFVEGESLRDRLSRELQLPIADAVRLASEVASALDYAHRHGVIHRDIKPENILLHDGQALVADFGIALAASKAGGGRMTETGMSLGTPTYMSPEQALGEREISSRSDVYALGAMSYEMLVGEPPFTGPSAQAIIARVMTEDPRPPSAQRKTIPPNVEAAVLTALQKLPADRFATAAEFAAALTNPNATIARTGAQPFVVAQRRRGWMTAGVAALLALTAGLMIGGRNGDHGSLGPSDVARANIYLGDSTTLRAIDNLRLAIAPSGERFAFVGSDGADDALWVRELNEPSAHPLPGTRRAFAPFFSPDGHSIGFFVVASGGTQLKVIPAAGGVVRTVVQDSVASFGGADWGDDGQIYFTNSSRGLSRVPATGGPVTVITHADSASGIREQDYPDVLPGSRRALVMLWKGSVASNHIGVVDLATGAVTDLTEGSYARFLAPGFVAIGVSDGRVLVARFDPRHGRLEGTPVPMLQDVQEETTNGTVQFAVSETGTMLYLPRSGSGGGISWVDRSGRQTPVDTSMRGVTGSLALSPDGTQIALTRVESGATQVWVKQLTTGTLTRLSFDVENADRPVWSPDGKRVAFLATRNDRRTSWVRKADGSDSLHPAAPGSTRLDEIGFDPLGRYTVLRTEGAGLGSRRVLLVENGVDTIPRVLLQSRFDQFAMTVSPDGRWLAYVSNESGFSEVYVRPFPNVDSARFAISVGGGMEPVWRRDGGELFFRNARGEMFAVPVTTGRSFTAGTPRMLFSISGLTLQEYYRTYDVSPDGKRFLMLTSGGDDAKTLNVIFNWRAELERLESGAE